MSFSLKSIRSLKSLSFRTCLYHTSPRLTTFWVRDEKGGYKGTNEKLPPFRKRLPEGIKQFKKECILFSKEIQADIHGTNFPLIIRPGEIDIVWKFKDESDVDNWVTTADSDHNEGFSNCQLSLTREGKGLFSGNLCKVVTKDGKIARAGYCNMKTKTFRKSFKREIYLDWTLYNVLNLRVRGDGRAYFVNIGNKGYFDILWDDMFHYIMFTRGGPYWQNIRIPFSKFFLSSRGRIQDKQVPIALDKISTFSFTLADKTNGPFALEIDYVGLEHDPTHKEEFAYETYETPNNIAAS